MTLSETDLTDSERQDLMAYPIGGVYCGLWRKRIIIENNAFFPEHLRYEDNYWITVIKTYLSRVSFTEKICYYYRKNPSSTVNSLNVDHHKDRITIENKTLDFFRARNSLDKYYEAIEFLYAQRYYLNTYSFMILRYKAIQKETIKKIHSDLKRNFPNWRKNKYYRELRSRKGIVLDFVKWHFPIVFAYVFKVIKRS